MAATIMVGPPDDAVLEPAPSVLEVPIGAEAILWGEAPVPLHLSPSALATWWHFDGATPLDAVIRGVADTFNETAERVRGGVRSVAAMLLDAGLLRDAATGELAPVEPAAGDPPRAAVIDTVPAEWLERRGTSRVDLMIGNVHLAVTANTEHIATTLQMRFASLARSDGHPAPVRYCLVDAGPGAGARYWLLSDSGLPLDHAVAADDLLDRLAEHLGEVHAVQSGDGVPLRLGVLEADDHCVAVQWDLLACRPVLEEPLGALGYRIASRQWAIVDPDRRAVLPVVPIDGAEPEQPPLPLRGVVLWFGPGSLDPPRTHGEWVWSLAMMGCAGADHRPTDREGLVQAAHELVTSTRLAGLTDPGPSALLVVLTDVAHGAPR